mmetsp:Transcript_64524/g.167743  ORF Transcript_64524/g.167743 Transcript_64524/m.167743 type:complete len:478 (+) Transcript_64524:108-1541(+)
MWKAIWLLCLVGLVLRLTGQSRLPAAWSLPAGPGQHQLSLQERRRLLQKQPHWRGLRRAGVHAPQPQRGVPCAALDETPPTLAVGQQGSRSSLLDELTAAGIIIGCGIGGSFLALPRTTGLAGFLPSTTMMGSIWLFMYLQATVVCDVIVLASKQGRTSVSYPTVARSALGPVGGVIVSSLFLMLMVLTQISQFSGGGRLLSLFLGLPYAASCALLALLLSSVTLLAPIWFVGRFNGLLTVGFICSILVLFAVGAPLVQWSRLAHANWSCWWEQTPSLLKILLYHEVMPTICQLLEFNKKRIRRAVFVGALLVLLLNICWSALGIGLVPFSVPLFGKKLDPVEVLLHAGGPVALAINVLGACAIWTTVISTNLATQAFFADICRGRGQPTLPLLLAGAVVVCTLVVATTSPGIFFRAINLQGAYPLTVLWGILPPVIALRMGAARDAPCPRRKALLYVALACVAGLALAGRLRTDLL